jgi:hypothetical protein
MVVCLWGDERMTTPNIKLASELMLDDVDVVEGLHSATLPSPFGHIDDILESYLAVGQAHPREL